MTTTEDLIRAQDALKRVKAYKENMCQAIIPYDFFFGDPKNQPSCGHFELIEQLLENALTPPSAHDAAQRVDVPTDWFEGTEDCHGNLTPNDLTELKKETLLHFTDYIEKDGRVYGTKPTKAGTGIGVLICKVIDHLASRGYLSSAPVVPAEWNEALTLAHNICTQEIDRINADDGSCEAMNALMETQRRIKCYLKDEPPPPPAREQGVTEIIDGLPCGIQISTYRLNDKSMKVVIGNDFMTQHSARPTFIEAFEAAIDGAKDLIEKERRRAAHQPAPDAEGEKEKTP